MFMELADGGTLLDMLRRKKNEGHVACSVEESRFYVAEICTALEFMHSEQVVHRDLKPENILVMKSGHIQLTDMGTALNVRENECETDFVGTPQYVSPEVLHDEPATFAADLWGLGCICFQLLVGRVPFSADSEWLIFQVILDHCSGQHPLQIPENVHEAGAAELITGLLLANPLERMDMEAVKHHDFLQGLVKEGSHLHDTLTPPWIPGINTELEGEELLEFSQEWLHEAAETTELAITEIAPPNIWVNVSNPSEWQRLFLLPGESALFCAPTFKRKGFSVKLRQLLLTENPANKTCRLLYIDKEAMEIKGVVPWSQSQPVIVRVRDDKHFNIISPLDNSRAYHFSTIGEKTISGARVWAEKINQALKYQVT